MSKGLAIGVASARGDCLENVVAPPSTQAAGGTRTRVGEGVPNVDRRPKSLWVDELSHGDHPGTLSENACLCCKGQFEKLNQPKTPSRVMYCEIPKPKFGGISVTAHDYKAHVLTKREMPEWHPYVKHCWERLDVPSIAETTYRRDFAPPVTPNRASRLHLRSKRTKA